MHINKQPWYVRSRPLASYQRTLGANCRGLVLASLTSCWEAASHVENHSSMVCFAAGQVRKSHAGDPRVKAGAQHLCGRVWRSSAEGSQGAEKEHCSTAAALSYHDVGWGSCRPWEMCISGLAVGWQRAL